MKLDDFDYYLPENLIAQSPLEQRDGCRLMVLDRREKTVEHRHFYDILDYVNPGDCLVLNDSRVIPARMYGLKMGTGAHIELLLIKRIEGDRWECLVKPGKRLHDGDTVILAGKTDTVPAGSEPPEEGYTLVNGIEQPFLAHVLDIYDRDNGTRLVEFEYDGIFMERLEEIGSMPLPPYITRVATDSDKEMYQTVYSRVDGSVAAPTAGLHFTKELLAKAADKGVRIAYVTLHVGIGTFRPVKAEKVEDHRMHFEEYEISESSADMINETKKNGGRIISVGTTSTRTCESAADENGYVRAGSGSTDIFIYPGYEFKVLDGLITNFHLPESTLIMLVSAYAGYDNIMNAYKTAVDEKYRFFSFGDAMAIL
jgi:S-adenosylmethionine:tRNA ribosyltransferase-isomerase